MRQGLARQITGLPWPDQPGDRGVALRLDSIASFAQAHGRPPVRQSDLAEEEHRNGGLCPQRGPLLDERPGPGCAEDR